ncbi:protein PFC0760c [Nilaparvata lugens]|uniref:protein PFC0760c n=1 Tax=Nilaparvata lugens TaxID=108931 RepID=UPI00193DA223|nr:protein PFC0760c [Nilaparvata lugens]
MISSCQHITFTTSHNTQNTLKTTPGQLSCKARDMFLLTIIFLTLVFIFVKSLDISQDVLQLPAIPEVTSTQISISQSVNNAPQCQVAVSSEAGDKGVLLLNETNVSNHHLNVEKTVSDLECSRSNNTGNVAVELHERNSINDPLTKSDQEDQVCTEYNKSVDDEDDLINEIYSVGVSVKESICKGLLSHQKSSERSTVETSISNNKCVIDNVSDSDNETRITNNKCINDNVSDSDNETRITNKKCINGNESNSDNETSITNNKCINDVPIDSENSTEGSALESLRRMQVICSEMRDALMSARMGSDRCTDSCDRFGNQNCDLDLESSASKSSVDTTKHSHTSITHKSTSDINPIDETNQPQVQLNDNLQQEQQKISEDAMKDESQQLGVTDYSTKDGGSNQLGVEDHLEDTGRHPLEVDDQLVQLNDNLQQEPQGKSQNAMEDVSQQSGETDYSTKDGESNQLGVDYHLKDRGRHPLEVNDYLKQDDRKVLETEQTINIFEPTDDFEMEPSNNKASYDNVFVDGAEILETLGDTSNSVDKLDLKFGSVGESELTKNNDEDRSEIGKKDKSGIEIESGGKSELPNDDKDVIKGGDKSIMELESDRKSEITNNDKDINKLEDRLYIKLKNYGESELTNNDKDTIKDRDKSIMELGSGGGSELKNNDKDTIRDRNKSIMELESGGESELKNNDKNTIRHNDKLDIELESGGESVLKNDNKDEIKHRDETSIESESYEKSELTNTKERDINDEPVLESMMMSDNDNGLNEKDGNEIFGRCNKNNLIDGNDHVHYMHRGSINSSGSMVRVKKTPSTISMYEMDEFLFWERLRDVIARCHKNGESYSQNIIDYYSSDSNITEIQENSGVQFDGINKEIQLSQFNPSIQVDQGKNRRIGLSSRTSRYLQNENTFPRHIFGQESMNRSLGPLVIFFGEVEKPEASRGIVEENRKVPNTELIPFTHDGSIHPMDEIRSKTMSFDTLQSDQRNSSISGNSIGSEVCGRLICYDSSSHCIGSTNSQQDKGDRNKRRFDKYYSVYKKFENSEH